MGEYETCPNCGCNLDRAAAERMMRDLHEHVRTTKPNPSVKALFDWISSMDRYDSAQEPTDGR